MQFIVAAAVLAAGLSLVGLRWAARGSAAASPAPAPQTGGLFGPVANILGEKCVSCHYDGGIAPFALTSAADAARYAHAILAVTQARLMPPWPLGNDSPPMLGQSTRQLSEGELAAIARWVNAGAPTAGAQPVTPRSQQPPPAGTRTLTLALPRPYLPHATADGLDDYHCFLLDPHLAKDVYVEGATIRPGSPAEVHHVILFEVTGSLARAAQSRERESGGGGWSCFGGPGLQRTSGARLPQWLAVWTPGHVDNALPRGTGILLPHGAKIVAEVHYSLLHGSHPDRTQLQLTTVPAAGSHLIALRTSALPAPVELPCPDDVHTSQCTRGAAIARENRLYGAAAAGIPDRLLRLCGQTARTLSRHVGTAAAITTSCDRSVPKPLTLYGVSGHMHLRGRDIRIELDPGTARARTLLHIPAWDFRWQDVYYLRRPIRVERGETVRVTCRFDNSTADQPAIGGKLQPPRYVLWGEGTEDEMCLGLVSVSAASAGSAAKPASGAFYVSPSGNDKAAGTSPSTAWRTLARVNGIALRPGATILLQGGKTFTGPLTFTPQDHGTPLQPITVGTYGAGRATIRARRAGIFIHDTAGIRMSNLVLVGPGLPGVRSAGIGALNDLPGILKLPFLQIDNVQVSGFRWGIYLLGNKGKSGFRDVRITRVVAHDNTISGIDVEGLFSSSAKTYAHENVYIGRSLVFDNPGLTSDAYNPTGNGILLSDVDHGTIEYCVAYDNGRLGAGKANGPVGIWAFDANHLVVQHNESYRNRVIGPFDGGGFDFDGGVSNSVMQDNYSHDNDGAGFLVTQFKHARPNRNNVVRNNTSWNDARKNGAGALWLSAGIRAVSIYGNKVFVSPRHGSAVAAVAVSRVEEAGQVPYTTGVSIHDNVFETTGGAPVVAVDSKHRNLRFANNDYFPKGGPLVISWRGSVYHSLVAWGARTGEERVAGRRIARHVDPKLVQPESLKLALPIASTGVTSKRFWILLGIELAIAAGLINSGIIWWSRVTRRRGMVPELALAPPPFPRRGTDGEAPRPRVDPPSPPLPSGGNGANVSPATTSAPPSVVHEDGPVPHETTEVDRTLAQAREERDRLQDEVATLTALRNELRTKYQALALAALDALHEDAPPEPGSGKGNADGSGS